MGELHRQLEENERLIDEVQDLLGEDFNHSDEVHVTAVNPNKLDKRRAKLAKRAMKGKSGLLIPKGRVPLYTGTKIRDIY